MLGRVGLDVTNSINSELGWKTVTKGKRSRKPVGMSVNGHSESRCKSPKRVADFSGSDSDKFGENVNGQRIIDQIEYVPFKKRRHLLQSPSPPHTLQSIESLSRSFHTPSSEHYGSSGQQSSGSYSNRHIVVEAGVSSGFHDTVVVDKVSGVTGGELYDSNDFSGIALLAATACSHNIDDETNKITGDAMEVSSMQSYNTSDSAGRFRESFSCLQYGNPFQKDVASLVHKKSSVMDKSVATSDHSDKEAEGMPIISVSAKVDRQHWDLNTLMEAWEEPPDGSLLVNTLKTKAAVGELGGEGSLPQSDFGNCSENHPHQEQIDKMSESSKSKHAENKTVEFSCHDRSCILEISDNDLNGQQSAEVLSLSHGDRKSPRKVLSKTGCYGPGISTSGGNTNATSELLDLDITLPEVPVLEKSACRNDGHMKDAENCMMVFQPPREMTTPGEEIIVDPCNVLRVEISESTSEDHSLTSSKCEGVSTSDISIGCHSVVSGNANGNENFSAAALVRADVAELPDSGMISSKQADLLVSSGIAVKTSIPHGLAKGLGSEDSHKSDVSEDDQGHFDGTGNAAELQVDYDSYEDGELRGSILYSWEGNEIEEDECVDYESDGRGGDSNSGDYPGSDIVETGSAGSQGTEKKILSGMQATETDSRKPDTGISLLRKELKDGTEKIETRSKKVANQGSGIRDEMPNEIVLNRKHSADVFDVRGLYVGVAGSNASRGKLQSCIEAPSTLGISRRKEPIYAQHSRSRNAGGPFSRSERDGFPDRFITRYRSSVHEHGRDGGDNRLVHWGTRNYFPSSYRGPEDHGQGRVRNSIADSVDKFGGMNFHDHKQPVNYSSKGMQRPLLRRRSPINWDDGYGVQRRVGGTSNFRSRGSSGNFVDGVGRGIRDNDTVLDDCPAPSGRMPHYLSRREHSFSPCSRSTHISAPRRKSHSRSRTRSPPAWQPERERNLGARRHSISPEFRSVSRAERTRVPFQKPSFTADYGESYISPPRARFSPQQNYRWVDERGFVDGNLRPRRSPIGTFRRNQRSDHDGLAGRLKSDEYFRSTNRPRRGPHMAGIGMGCKLEENCDDRRNDDRSGMVQRVRQSNSGSILRRPRHDAANLLTGYNNNDVRATDRRRDVPWSTEEDKRLFKV